MLSFSYIGALLVLNILSFPLAQGQFVDDLPQCIQDCIDQSPDTNCDISDIGCICRASAGNFLPDVVTCMHGNCDNNLDTNLLLTPLQFACMIAGSPIPGSAIRNAENAASSLATQVTTTVTMGGSSADGGAGATTTVYSPSVSVSTVTVTTTQSGRTWYQIYPITVESTTTVTGPTSTLTSVSTASPTNGGFTGVVPIIVVSTDSEGSTYTSTTTQPGVISTYTTTDSRGSTMTQKSTITETASTSETSPALGDNSSSSSASETTDSSESTTTTSVAAAMTSSSATTLSTTRNAPNPDATNSSPFKDTNAAGTLAARSWLGLSVLLVVMCIWV
ncbi:hypothetical protein IFR04_001108 [Cadophora malorum]|uniref:CFEM domain-containing protein n=1 Tax=Cadophora malorum TaxID=108018 RepID=A0A8H8BVL6_9HELO|nr:hypothetical protein IFR04_001108 [Cadophora malorum]